MWKIEWFKQISAEDRFLLILEKETSRTALPDKYTLSDERKNGTRK